MQSKRFETSSHFSPPENANRPIYNLIIRVGVAHFAVWVATLVAANALTIGRIPAAVVGTKIDRRLPKA